MKKNIHELKAEFEHLSVCEAERKKLTALKLHDNGIRTHNHLVRKRTLNQLAKLVILIIFKAYKNLSPIQKGF